MDKFKKKLITASASQNLETKSDLAVHRFIPMLVAENMNRIEEYLSGEPLPRIDLWNCVGMSVDKSFREQNKYFSRMDFSSSLLEDKYSILEEFGISSNGRKIIRDDDNATKDWFNSKLNSLRSAGIIYTEKIDVDICNSCDYLKSISEKHDGGCTRCEGEDFHSEEREILMLDIPESRNSLIENRIVYPHNIKHIKGFFNQLPPRIMISKMRDYGLSLDSFGLPDFVLDPKIGVALMPELIAEMDSLSDLTLVQGASITTNTIPYTSLMTSGFNHNYVLLPKIPKMGFDEAKKLGLSFFGRHLPFVLMEHKENITPSQLENVRKNYYNIMNKINTVVPNLQPDGDSLMQLDSEEHQMVSEILDDFGKYQIKEGRQKLNLFFKRQGRKFAEKSNGSVGGLNSSDAKTLEDLVGLFYV